MTKQLWRKDKKAKLIAPWPDFKGRDIYEGDRIIHPFSGEKGTVVFGGRWLVKYDDCEIMSQLCLQVGDKGMAEVMDGDRVRCFGEDEDCEAKGLHVVVADDSIYIDGDW